jgi:hypothetical protein
MLPAMTAHGELVCSVLARGPLFGRTTVSATVESRELFFESSPDFDLQQAGIGCRAVYWFVRVPAFGVGLEYLSSRIGFDNGAMDLVAVYPTMILRYEIGKSSSFPHGRIVPYMGIGIGALALRGRVGPLFPDRPEEGLELRFQSASVMGKAGLEWIVCRTFGFVSGLAIFLEGRFLAASLSLEEESYYRNGTGWFGIPMGGSTTRKAQGELSCWQLAIGASLHLGIR